MTTQQPADELNRKGLYHKKDGSEITAFQIQGRTRKYPHLFDREGAMVSLKDNKTNSGVKESKPEHQS